jgi:1-acyl-sn-glycerol-3-phosphate acyltransferase
MVFLARCRLAALWVSQTARVLADNCLRMIVALEVIAGIDLVSYAAAWHLLNVFVCLPFVLFAPVNGAIANHVPKRLVVLGSAMYCFSLPVLLGTGREDFPEFRYIVLTVVMAGAAVFGPARFALLPAAAKDARIPLSRINGFMEAGTTVATVAGMILVVHINSLSWGVGIDAKRAIPQSLAMANFICFLTAVPVWFASDVRRPASVGQVIEGFFLDCQRIWQIPIARHCLLLLAGFWGLLAAGCGAVIALTDSLFNNEWPDLIQGLSMVASGTACGAILAGLQTHPRRALGLVPLGAAGLLVSMAWAGLSHDWMGVPALVGGFMAGLIIVPLRSAYQGAVPADARGNAMAFSDAANSFMVIALAMPIYLLTMAQIIDAEGQLWLIAVLTGVLASTAIWFLFREVLELFTEFLIWPFYRIRGHGPGLDGFPLQGPAIVVANHSAWLDPVWIAKVLPRRLTPMMTSVFYDKPILRWLMVHVVHAIRVEASEFRREAPELRQAVAALDRGECVVVFPEGRMRRRDDQLLHRFGQGIWHILRERPNTPVIPCWIEGGWGSYFSYGGGPPTRNKRFDRWRRIDVAVSEPRIIEPSVLQDHRATRIHLMQACLDARRYLGLDSPPASAFVLHPELGKESGDPA